jgi:hypothetical protein
MKNTQYYDEFRIDISCEEDVRVVNVGDRRMWKGDDLVFFHLHFEPQLKSPEQFFVEIFYLEQKHCCLKLKIDVVGEIEKITIEDRVFCLYPTYQLELSEDGKIKTLFLTLENNNLSFNNYDDGKPIVQPRIDGFPGDPRLKSIPYIPLHPDDLIYEGRTLEGVAQRTPLWYHIRTQEQQLVISGTSIEKYICGYWVERNNNSESKDVKTILRDRRIQANNFRYGRIIEPETMIITMYNMPEVEAFEDCGRITFPVPEWLLRKIPEPVCFTCSPDCCMAKSKGKRIVMEYKASYFNTSLPDYYLPQLYWEMMATNSDECRLVRYKKIKCQNMHTGVWYTRREACMYIVKRDPDVEKQILDTLCYTLNMLPYITLDELYTCDRFLQMKCVFERIVRETPAIDLKIPLDILQKFENYKKSTQST